MPGFSCRKCGHGWSEGHNMPGPCPCCGGFGRRDPKCVCPHLRLGLAGQAQMRNGTDDQCPVHGTIATAKGEAKASQ